MAFLDGLDRFLARRVEKANKAEQNKGFGQVARTETACFDVRILQPCQRQYALALGGELVRGLHEMRAVERSRLAARGLLPITVLKNDFRSAFDE